MKRNYWRKFKKKGILLREEQRYLSASCYKPCSPEDNRERNQPLILYPAEIYFRNEGAVNTYSGKRKLRNRHVIQEGKKGASEGGRKELKNVHIDDIKQKLGFIQTDEEFSCC